MPRFQASVEVSMLFRVVTTVPLASSALRRCFSASAWAARICASKDSRRRCSSPSKSLSLGATWTGSEVSSLNLLLGTNVFGLRFLARLKDYTRLPQVGGQNPWRRPIFAQSFTMGVKVFTPVERIAGFSGKTMGTGRGNFWIICTTSNEIEIATKLPVQGPNKQAVLKQRGGNWRLLCDCSRLQRSVTLTQPTSPTKSSTGCCQLVQAWMEGNYDWCSFTWLHGWARSPVSNHLHLKRLAQAEPKG